MTNSAQLPPLPDPSWLKNLDEFALQRHDEQSIAALTASATEMDEAEDGTRTYRWLDSEERSHREDGPATIAFLNGYVTAFAYIQDSMFHRVGGPAHVELEQGRPVMLEWMQEDMLLNPDGPVDLTLFPNGTIKYLSWMDDDGEYHREDAPAAIEYSPDGIVLREDWYEHGRFHRHDQPAAIFRFPDGTIDTQWYYVDGELDRDYGPAKEEFYEDGAPKSRTFYRAGKVHKEDGPAFESYYLNGTVEEQHWAKNDKFIKALRFDEEGRYHSVHAPAVAAYDKRGKLKKAEYWGHGTKYDSLEEVHAAVGYTEDEDD